MLKVRLVNGSGVIREQSANGSKYHVYGPPKVVSQGKDYRTIDQGVTSNGHSK